MSEFVPQNTIGSGFDYLTSGTQPSEKGVAPGQKNTLRLWDTDADRKANIGRGEIIINDFSQQGYNHPEGDFSENSNGFAWSGLITNRPGELLPPVLNIATSKSVTGNLVGLHSAYAFSVQFFGIGSAANSALFKEASATDPTPTAITFSPGGAICSLTRVLAAGVERLAVGMIGAPVKLMSDASGTVATTMDASTNSCWGIILSGINATTAGVPVMLMYCGTSITTKATDAVLTTATVATVPPTTVNAGGFAIGAIKAAGRAQRAYWGIPRVSNTNGALKFGAEAMCDIKSTDMTGSDLLPVDLDYLPNGILYAVPFRDGILAHDGTTVVYWDGDKTYNLGIFRRRVKTGQTTNVIDSDDRRRVRQLVVNGPECGVVWQWFDVNAVATGKGYFEMYNFETGTWHNAGQILSLSATGATPDLVLGCGANSISPNTRYFYSYYNNDTAFWYNYVPRPGESLLWQNSLGSGGTYTNDIPSYTGSALLGCRWWLDERPPGYALSGPMIKRAPKVITEVEFGGNLDHGGTGAGAWTFNVQVQGRGIDGTTTLTAYNETFAQGKPSTDYRKRNTATKRANIHDVQIYLVAATADASSPQKVAQLLPITIRFAYSKDDKPITSLPEDVKQ